MCGRYVSPEQAAIERAFRIGRHSGDPFKRKFNVFPSDTVPFLRRLPDSPELELVTGRWGFVPHWWKDPKPPRSSHIARVEEAAGKPMWRDAWSRARCLVPAEGWYEWQSVESLEPATGEIRRMKQPYYICRAEGRLLCFAGLAAHWRNPQNGETLVSCAILTAPAAGPLARIHERMPLVLPESANASWLDREFTDAAAIRSIAATHAELGEFLPRKVRLLVNNAKADGPELIAPLDAATPDLSAGA
jgi:putative SOS response-associated peptidase YedK